MTQPRYTALLSLKPSHPCLPVLFALLLALLVTPAAPKPSTPSTLHSQMWALSPENIYQLMGCSGHTGPIDCKAQEDWVLLFFNSSDYRQQSTFQYLVAGMANELYYAREGRRANEFQYPAFAVIDCYSSASLCSEIGEDDLPLALYKEAHPGQLLRYRGYISLPGLISFTKSHDPHTSYMAEEYEEEGEWIIADDLPSREIKRVMREIGDRIRAGEERAKLAIETMRGHGQGQRENMKAAQEPKVPEEPKAQVKVDEPSIKQVQTVKPAQQGKAQAAPQTKKEPASAEKPKQGQQEQKTRKKSKETKAGKKEKQKPKPNQPANYTNYTSQGQKEKQKQKSGKKDEGTFLPLVDSATQAVVGKFAELGLSGFILEFIGVVVYSFFFVVFGILCIAVQAL